MSDAELAFGFLPFLLQKWPKSQREKLYEPQKEPYKVKKPLFWNNKSVFFFILFFFYVFYFFFFLLLYIYIYIYLFIFFKLPNVLFYCIHHKLTIYILIKSLSNSTNNFIVLWWNFYLYWLKKISTANCHSKSKIVHYKNV